MTIPCQLSIRRCFLPQSMPVYRLHSYMYLFCAACPSKQVSSFILQDLMQK